MNRFLSLYEMMTRAGVLNSPDNVRRGHQGGTICMWWISYALVVDSAILIILIVVMIMLSISSSSGYELSLSAIIIIIITVYIIYNNIMFVLVCLSTVHAGLFRHHGAAPQDTDRMGGYAGR